MCKSVFLLLFSALFLVAGCRGYGPTTGDKFRQITLGPDASAAAMGLLSEDAEVRRWSIIKLSRTKDPAAVEAIALLLDPKTESVPLVRATAAVGLRVLGDPRGLPAIRDAANDPEPLVRAEAARSMGFMGGEDEIPLLAKILSSDPEGEVRLQAAVALGQIGGEKTLPPLINALDDLNESVVFVAHESLQQQTGQNLPESSAQWKAWLEAR